MIPAEETLLKTVRAALPDVAPEAIAVDANVSSDWDGSPRVIIRVRTRSIESFQFGRALTVYDGTIDVLAADRETVETFAAPIVAAFDRRRSIAGDPVKNIALISRDVARVVDGQNVRSESAATLKYEIYQLATEDRR